MLWSVMGLCPSAARSAPALPVDAPCEGAWPAGLAEIDMRTTIPPARASLASSRGPRTFHEGAPRNARARAESHARSRARYRTPEGAFRHHAAPAADSSLPPMTGNARGPVRARTDKPVNGCARGPVLGSVRGPTRGLARTLVLAVL